ncbi:MAG: LamG-like jellyroll fold domain-containing protein [Planctomycetota bacterium]|jgi:hypothetical protein
MADNEIRPWRRAGAAAAFLAVAAVAAPANAGEAPRTDLGASIEEMLSAVGEEPASPLNMPAAPVEAGPLGTCLAGFDRLIDKGDLAGAKAHVRAAAAKPVLAASAALLRAAGRLADSLAERRAAMRDRLAPRVGRTVTVRTTSGLRKGELAEVTDAGLVLVVKSVINREVRGVRRVEVAWADLTLEEQERLAEDWLPDPEEGAVARAAVALARKDARAAGAALEGAGTHPLAAHLGRRLRVLTVGAVEARAEAAWAALAKQARAGLPASRAEEVLEEIARFEKAYGKTKFFAANGKAIRAAAAAVGSGNEKVVRLPGLELWFRADRGANPGRERRVGAWADSSGKGRDAAQRIPERRPVLARAGGRPVVRFDGVDDHLGFTWDPDGLVGMTIITVSSCARDVDTGRHNVERAVIWWGQDDGWGNVVVAPHQRGVGIRFGTGQTSNWPRYARPAPLGPGVLTITTSLHDGASGTDHIYVDGARVVSEEGKRKVLAGNLAAGKLGRGEYDTYFPGDIAEVLVYSRALTAAERSGVERYLGRKYRVRIGAGARD